MQIELDRSSREPLYRQLATTLQQRIRSGALPPTTRLPTVRQLAQQLGVTRLTVHSAYAELQSRGWIEATVGRGTFVAAQDEALLDAPQNELGREVTPAGVINDMMRTTQLPGLYMLARADPAVEMFPLRQWQRATEAAFAAGGQALLGYTTAQGDVTLRSVLAEVAHERGITAGPDEIVVTAGVTNGMSLVTQLLARPGDTVLVEQPTYLGMLSILATNGVRTVGVPTDDDGLIIEAVEQAIQAHRPAFLYTIPTFQNPRGVCLSHPRRAALLGLSEQYNLTIVEDDIYGRIAYEGPPPLPLKAHDRSGRVIYLDSFSKSLMPGLRIGFAITTPTFARRIVKLRQSQDLCSPPFVQRALATFIEQGWWHSHVKRMVPHYRERRDAMLQSMEQMFPRGVHWTHPKGGFACWVTLPANFPVTDLYLGAVAQGVAIAPGQVFTTGSKHQAHVRLCFGAETPARIAEAVTIVGDLLRDRGEYQTPPPPKLGEYIPLV